MEKEMIECPECNGSGLMHKQDPRFKAGVLVCYCQKCGGSGEVEA